MTFSHYILTRFNLPLSSLKKGQTSNVCRQEYLHNRFELFENYCLPSIKKQSCQDFKWLILFDINTPEEFKKRAAGWHDVFPNLIPCYLDVYRYGCLPPCSEPVTDVDTDRPMQQVTSHFVTEFIKSIEEDMPEWILTSRLDSDDALHRDWVSNLHRLFAVNPHSAVLDFVYSYKYIPGERIAYRYKLPNGHFITLAEQPGDNFRSVLFCNHLDIDRHFKVEHIYGKTFQTELIHSNNVVNGYTDLSISGLLHAFFHFRGRDFGYNTVRYSRVKALYMVGSLIKQRLFKK